MPNLSRRLLKANLTCESLVKAYQCLGLRGKLCVHIGLQKLVQVFVIPSHNTY